MNTYVNPVSDIFVKYLLGSEENGDILISFINAVQRDSDFNEIVSVEIKNPFNLKEFKSDKESILDIKAKDNAGRLYDIEVQSVGNESFKIRSLYYWAKLYTGQLQENEYYSILSPAICINLLDFEIFRNIKYYHTCFLLREKAEPEYILTDHLQIHFLELPKISELKADSTLLKWLLFFKFEGRKEEIMEILIKDNEIAKAHNVYKKFTEDDRLREVYESRLKWKLDYNSDMEQAKQEGLKEGIEKGIEKGLLEGKLDTARNLHKLGIDIEKIRQATNLSLEEIRKAVGE